MLSDTNIFRVYWEYIGSASRAHKFAPSQLSDLAHYFNYSKQNPQLLRNFKFISRS